MPSLGADMDEGTLLEWLVAPGDEVHRGDVIAVVDTVKSAIEVEVFEDGVVEELLVQPGVTVAVGTPMARLSSSDHPQSSSGPPVTSPIVRHLAHEQGVDLSVIHGSGPKGEITRDDVESVATPVVSSPEPAPEQNRPRISPLARRRAEELGVDLATVTGSATDGVVKIADVERAAESSEHARVGEKPVSPPPAVSARDKRLLMRQAIGDLMSRSKREIPHYYLTTTIDLAVATEWLREANANRPVQERLVPAALLLKAVALAARTVPEVNGYFKEGSFEPAASVHLGVAVSLRGGGLVAPAIQDADQTSVADLMSALKDLVARARAGRLRGSEMADPTITVTNLGDRGVESVIGVIYPPQVALVGFGRIVERPWAVSGTIAVHPVVTATLAADHRVTDGHRGGLFLTAVDELLQHPEDL